MPRAHPKPQAPSPKPASTALTVVEPDKPALLPEFDSARRHVDAIRTLGRRTVHESVLLGYELNRLKKELGVKHGGSRASTQTAYLKPWREMIVEQTGLSEDTCDRCMKLAAAAKKQIPLLTAEDVLTKPFSALSETRQAEVVKAIEKAADGRSMSQLMLDFGTWKDKSGRKPPAGGKSPKNDHKGGAANRVSLTPAQQREIALKNGNNIRDIIDGGTWQHLNLDELSAQHAMLDGWLQKLAEIIEARKTAELRAKGGKSK